MRTAADLVAFNATAFYIFVIQSTHYASKVITRAEFCNARVLKKRLRNEKEKYSEETHRETDITTFNKFQKERRWH